MDAHGVLFGPSRAQRIVAGGRGKIAQIAAEWEQIKKPIFAYYLGNHDPSGLDIERDLEEKLRRYSRRDFGWKRLAVLPSDFDEFDLLPLPLKATDRRRLSFIEAGHTEAAELDAIPAPALRKRLEEAILAHIPADEWNRLLEVEELEQESWQKMLDQFKGRAARRRNATRRQWRRGNGGGGGRET